MSFARIVTVGKDGIEDPSLINLNLVESIIEGNGENDNKITFIAFKNDSLKTKFSIDQILDSVVDFKKGE